MARDEDGRLTTQDDNEDGPSDQRDGQPTERRGGPRAAKPARNWVPCGHSCGHGPGWTHDGRAKLLREMVDLEGFELSIILIACKLLILQRGRSVEKVEKA
jgi:hypothetical protein